MATQGRATALPNGPATIPKVASKLPAALQVPLLVVLNFGFTFGLFTVGSAFTGYELSAVSRADPTVWQAVAFPLGKIAECYVGWKFGLDDYDMAALTLLSRAPFYYFLTAYYDVSLTTSAICIGLDALGTSLPFSLLRRRSLSHTRKAPVPNASIIQSNELTVWTTLLCSSIYALFMFASAKTWLPMHLVLHFDGIHSLNAAYEALHLKLIGSFIPLGWAARTFLFSPSAAARPNLGDIRKEHFNPSTATFSDTVKHNLWGWRTPVKVLLGRTALLAAYVGLSGFIKLWGAVEGVDVIGAAGWSALWAVSSLVVGGVVGYTAEL